MGRISALTELTTLASNDYIIVLDSSANIAKKITVANAFAIPDYGWTPSGETWVYTSATTITVPTDATTKYKAGNFVKISQTTGGTKYGIIKTVAATLLTIRWLNSATLANETISSPQYSPLATPFGTPGIGAEAIDFATTGEGGVWWEEIGRATGTSLSLTSLPARKYLRVILDLKHSSGNITSNIRFNNDSGSNYAFDRTAGASLSQTSIGTGNSVMDQYNVIDITNVSGHLKLVNWYTVFRNGINATDAPIWDRTIGKWDNTAQITRIDYINGGGGAIASTSSLIVLGHN